MQMIDQLNSNLIDLAVVRTPFNARGLTQKTLFQDKMVAIGDHRQFTFPKSKMEVKDFDAQPIILYRRFESIFNDTFGRQGISPIYSVKCDDARTAVTWANAGMGIAIVPQSIAISYAKQPVTTIDYANWNSDIQLV